VPVGNIVLGAAASIALSPSHRQPNQTGSGTITLTVSDGQLSANDTIALAVTATPKQSWRLQNFGTANDTGNAADLADPDIDGLANLVEFALNLDPNKATPIPFTLAREGGDFTLMYTRERPLWMRSLLPIRGRTNSMARGRPPA
jgi:hypothetical protein